MVWVKLAELCSQYLAKGRQVYLEGRLQIRQWQYKDGQTKYTTEIQAQTVQFLGGGADRGAGRDQGAPMEPAGGDQGYGQQSPGPGRQGGGAEPSFTEDDIPF